MTVSPERVRARLGAPILAFVALGASACQDRPLHEITVVDGVKTTRIPVRSAFAEYVELPGSRNELRITLASYPVSCERWVEPGAADSLVAIVVVSPPGKPPQAGTYAWTGLPPADQPLAAPYALPKAVLAGGSRLFEPGGALRLSAVQLDPHGTVSGTLAFEFPGDGERVATRIDGSFEAKACSVSLAPP
ncbi:MAG TPA: hypothetical protein VHE30_02065 [Polyangiaceae bacterium]|nr:hypothetical protein [Polyangiaceae bacterium]